MKEITFNEVRNNYSDNNSVVLCGITPNCTADEVNEFFHESKFLNEDQNAVDVFHLSDNVLGEDGRSDLLVIITNGPGNPMVRLQLNMSGLSVKWTSDFLDNYAKDYISA